MPIILSETKIIDVAIMGQCLTPIEIMDKYHVIELDNITIDEDNAHISIVVKNETWTNKDYPNLHFPFTSNIRISGIYAQKDNTKPRAPKGYARRLLCRQLMNFPPDYIVALEADPSNNDFLVYKVYNQWDLNYKLSRLWNLSLVHLILEED